MKLAKISTIPSLHQSRQAKSLHHLTSKRIPSLRNDSILNTRRILRIHNRQALKLTKQPRIAPTKSPRVRQDIRHTRPPHTRRAQIHIRFIAREDLAAREAVPEHIGDVDEDVAFVDAHAVAVAFDQVAGVGGPDVVDGVEEGAAREGRGAARGVVDVVFCWNVSVMVWG